MIKEINPVEAWKLLQENPDALLLDVRSQMEYDYVGHVPGSVHVSLKEPPAWETNSDFVSEVKQALAKARSTTNPEDLLILALCRSGARSMSAAETLAASGFNTVYNVAQGFEGERDDQGHRNSNNGWRYHGLPWEQS